jgi:hypothetical protein
MLLSVQESDMLSKVIVVLAPVPEAVNQFVRFAVTVFVLVFLSAVGTVDPVVADA